MAKGQDRRGENIDEYTPVVLKMMRGSLVWGKRHVVNEWRGCNVAWTETRGRFEVDAAADGLFGMKSMNLQWRGQKSRLAFA